MPRRKGVQNREGKKRKARCNNSLGVSPSKKLFNKMSQFKVEQLEKGLNDILEVFFFFLQKQFSDL